jgi:hypothetical protein
MAVKVKVVRACCGIRNVFARMPFRFGVITMRAAPLLGFAAPPDMAGLTPVDEWDFAGLGVEE